MDKTFLLEQLGARVRTAVETTHAASSEARTDARSGAARAVNMAKAQSMRSVAAREALDALDQFRVKPFGARDPIQLGAVVEVESELGGKTLFIAPVCGGEELTGPDGDGIFQVVTPASPFGRALLGKRTGAQVEVLMGGEPVDWTVTYVA